MKADFIVPPPFAFPPPITVEVKDDLTFDQIHTFASCSAAANRVSCRDGSSPGPRFKASFRAINPSTWRMSVTFRGITANAPFMAPITVTLTHDSVVIRTDTIMDCQARPTGISCHEQ